VFATPDHKSIEVPGVLLKFTTRVSNVPDSFIGPGFVECTEPKELKEKGSTGIMLSPL
jgi:hypothetical protein